jgi:hypothetical protein
MATSRQSVMRSVTRLLGAHEADMGCSTCAIRTLVEQHEGI